MLRTKSYLNGEWLGALDGATYPVNTATAQQLGSVPDMGADGTRRTIEAAAAAFPAWAGKTAGWLSARFGGASAKSLRVSTSLLPISTDDGRYMADKT